MKSEGVSSTRGLAKATFLFTVQRLQLYCCGEKRCFFPISFHCIRLLQSKALSVVSYRIIVGVSVHCTRAIESTIHAFSSSLLNPDTIILLLWSSPSPYFNLMAQNCAFEMFGSYSNSAASVHTPFAVVRAQSSLFSATCQLTFSYLFLLDE